MGLSSALADTVTPPIGSPDADLTAPLSTTSLAAAGDIPAASEIASAPARPVRACAFLIVSLLYAHRFAPRSRVSRAVFSSLTDFARRGFASPMRSKQAGPAVRSMQAGRLEEFAAVGGFHPHLEGAAVAIDCERHFDAGMAERPHAAEEAGEVVHLRAGDREHDVAGAQIGTLRRPTASEPRDHDPVLDLGGVKAKPRPRRAIGPSHGEEDVQYRLDQVDIGRPPHHGTSNIGLSRSIGT